jgi:hypothetical protein
MITICTFSIEYRYGMELYQLLIGFWVGQADGLGGGHVDGDKVL